MSKLIHVKTIYFCNHDIAFTMHIVLDDECYKHEDKKSLLLYIRKTVTLKLKTKHKLEINKWQRQFKKNRAKNHSENVANYRSTSAVQN